MSGSALGVEGLSTWLDGSTGVVRALDEVGFEIPAGQTLAIVGESGCGKSMTALSLMRLLPDNGRVVAGEARLAGENLLALPESTMRDWRGRRISMIFQEPGTSLNPVLTAGDQIAEVLVRHFATPRAEAARRAVELLDAVGIPDAARRAREFPFQMSGGMKQRVMIALALAAEPDLLVADEPTTALDVTIQAQVLELLRDLQRRRGTSILLITHDLGVVAQMADWVAVMYAGQIVEFAPRELFFASPQHPYARKLFAALPASGRRGRSLAVIPGQVPPLDGRLTGCRFAPRCDEVRSECRSEQPPWSSTPAHGRVRCFARVESLAGSIDEQGGASHADAAPRGAQRAPEDDPELLLEIEALKVHFPVRRGLLQRTVAHVKAVDGVSLAIPAGRTLALVGESGCGKTTVGRAVLQLIRPTAGAVRFRGARLEALDDDALRIYRDQIQIVFQDPYASLNPRMRVGDILREGMDALNVGDPAARGKRVDELLERVGLPFDAKRRYPHEFSGGQRQRIAIARALAVRPRVIVCDEPTSALDVSVQAQILNLLQRLQADLGVAYLFITHNLGVVEYLAHEVAVMYLGRIVERGPAGAVLRAPAHPYTRALLAAVPRLDARTQHVPLRGEMPSPTRPPAGCHFSPRCPLATDQCRSDYPQVRSLGAGREVACVLPGA